MKIATLCYIQHDNKVLMIHRVKQEQDLFKNFWNGVGGKVTEGESPEECVIREVWEETGLTIREPKLKGILTFPNNRGSGETWYVFVYIATSFTGELTENYEGTLEWVSLSKLNKLSIQNADKYFIKWLKRKGIFSAKFTYDGDSLNDLQVTFYT